MTAALPSWARQEVTVLRAALVNDHGTQISDWDSPSSRVLFDVAVVATAGPLDDLVNRTAVTTVLVLFTDLDADVRSGDRISYLGEIYDIDGAIRRYATGVLDHLEIPLKAVAG